MTPTPGDKSVLRFTVQDGFFFLILAGLSIAFYRVLSPFLVSVFAAVILAHGFFKPYRHLVERRKFKPHFASLVVTLLLAALIAVPLVLVMGLLSLEVSEGYQRFRNSSFYGGFSTEQLTESVKKIPFLRDNWNTLQEFSLHQKIEGAISTALQWVFQALQKTLVSTGQFLIQILFTLYLIYFLLLDNGRMGQRVYALLPIREGDARRIFNETLRIVEATLLGTAVVGVIEGTWGGLCFWALGIPSPMIWAVVMAVFSMLPVVGASTIMVPFAVFLLLTGSWIKGLILLLVGVGFISITTSIVKPKLVGDRTGLHPALVVLSTIGGIAWLGMVGFFIGPLIAALFLIVWTQFSERYKAQIRNLRPPPAPKS